MTTPRGTPSGSELAALRRVLRWLSEGAPTRGVSAARARAIDAAHARALRWLDSAGVVGFGIGRRRRAGHDERERVIKVYVERKQPLSRCAVPVDPHIEIDGRRVASTDVQELGKFRAHSSVGWTRPLRAGLGIGNARASSTGTLGFFASATGSRDEPVFLVSCAHVLAAHFPPETPGEILQPSRQFHGVALQHHVGTFVRFVPLVAASSGKQNVSDAALAELDAHERPDWTHANELPAGVASVQAGTRVHGRGAFTDLLAGKVTNPDFLLRGAEFPGADGTVWRGHFRHVVLCTRYGTTGDSGTAMLDERDRLVGLHMGAFDGQEGGSVFCAIGPVLSTLGVSPITR